MKLETELTEAQAAQLQQLLADLREAVECAQDALHMSDGFHLPLYVGHIIGIDVKIREWVQRSWYSQQKGS